MPYAMRADVKRVLLIPETEVSFDSEIDELILVADAHVDVILRKFFPADSLPLPPTHPDFGVVRHFEALWAAGLFRERREQKLEGEHVLVKLAREGLHSYLGSKYVTFSIV